jgi:hypothetical protein
MTHRTFGRRQVLAGTAAAFTARLLARPAQASDMLDWLDTTLAGPRVPVGVPQLGRFRDRIYYLLQPIAWIPDGELRVRHKTVQVPRGFVTDLASTPPSIWRVLPPDGNYAYAAIIHDYLYWFQTTSREDADDVFDQVMKEFSVPSAARYPMMEALRRHGEKAWNENAALKNRGEKRVLKRFPDDPRISWPEWKQDMSVFE